MIKKALPLACLVVGFAAIAITSVVSPSGMDGKAAPFVAHIDANDLTLKARNLPIQSIDDVI